MLKVDINCDFGEGFGSYALGNEEILNHISSINIACGFHAGDPSTMKRSVKLAIEKGLAIGAHPGLPDLIGFGRRNMAISAEEAYDMTVYQIGALKAFVEVEGGTLNHVKPHGALYNMAAVQPDLAVAIAQAIYDVDPKLILYGLANSEMILAGKMLGLPTANEVFADRTYQRNGTLTPRSQVDAMVSTDEDAVKQVIQMVKDKMVTAQCGTIVPIQADTICIHGDGAHALAFAKTIRKALQENCVAVTSFI